MKEAKKGHRGFLCDELTITEHCEATLNLMSHCFRYQCTAEFSVQDLTTAAMCHQVLCVSNAEHSYEFMGWVAEFSYEPNIEILAPRWLSQFPAL